jgi:FkbH-like protein
MFEQLQLDSVAKIAEMVKRPFRYRKISNQLITHHNFTSVKVRLIGGYTSDQLTDWLKIFATGLGINLEVDTSPWGPAYALAPSIDFSTDDSAVILCLNCAPDLYSKNEVRSIDVVVSEAGANWRKLCSSAQESGKKIIGTYFEDEMFRYPGVNKTKTSKHAISELNYTLGELSREFTCLHLVSITSLASVADLNSGISWRDWYGFGQCFNRELSLVLGHRCANLIAGFSGKGKKVLVLDLDNTLWAGVIGDDGINGIGLGDESYEARIHIELQRYAKGLMSRGVILAIASKNELQIAESAFSHPNMVLDWNDFICKEINWGRKSESIRKLALILNVGLDSIVFLDDNPVERDEVRSTLPMVMVPEIEDAPLDFLRFLHLTDPFIIDNNLTGEDVDRNLSFAAGEQRKKISESSGSHEEFLKALQTKVILFRPSPAHIERIVQLTNKTNQFNFTTLRLDTAQISAKIESGNHLVVAARIEDRFGVYGITSLVYIKILDDVAEIENWIMSCRVFSKSAEYAIMESLIEYLRLCGIGYIKANYIPTAKNMVISQLLPKLGFLEAVHEINNDSGSHFELDMTQPEKIQHFCEVINEL